MLLFVLIISVIVLANIAWSTVRLGISPTPSNPAMRQACAKLLKSVVQQNMGQQNVSQKPVTLIIAGSGWGGLATFLSKHHNGPIICYEAALVPWLCSRFLYSIAKHLKKTNADIQFIKKNTAKIDIPQNSIVICYLFPEGTQSLYTTITHAKTKPIGLLSIAFAVNHIPATITSKAHDWLNTPLYWYSSFS